MKKNTNPKTLAKGAELRMMTFNIWGDYFGNPPCEREQLLLDVVHRYEPDLLAVQEITKNWWQSPFFTELSKDYGIIRPDDEGNNYTPLLYNKKRLQLSLSGRKLFCPKLDGSKGVTWGIFQDQKTSKQFICFSTHFWWKSTDESNFIRTVNSQQLLDRIWTIQEIIDVPVIGGGDFNCCIDSDPLNELKKHDFLSAQEIADNATPVSSHHGDPVRGEDGKYHGSLRAKDNTPATSIDHIFVEANRINVLSEFVVLDQDALDASDHSPVCVDFSIK